MKQFLFLIFIALVLGLALFKLINNRNQNTVSLETNTSNMSEVATLLSRDELEKIKEKYIQIIKQSDPTQALELLRQEIKTDSSLARHCHSIVHKIGHTAYEKYNDFGQAMSFQDELCNSGYMHGVLEMHFSHSKDVLTEIKTVCSIYPENKFMSWECFHGIGHGVMFYTSNNLPQALEICESLSTSFAKQSCINGVFMENFNSDSEIHESKYLKETDPFYPCDEQPQNYKPDCYLYAPVYYLSLNDNKYIEALRWCLSAESNYQEICAAGVGSQAIKENINNPKLVEELCMMGSKSQHSPCINGMIGLFINHHGSLAPAEKICNELKPANRIACKNAIFQSRRLF